MKRRECREIPRQGIVSAVTPHARREGEALAEDVRSMSLRGGPLRLRLRNFRPTGDGYLAALGGPLPYMIRLREIARLTAAHEQRLGDARTALAATGIGGEAFAAAWRAEAEGWSFDEVNNLIDRHNRFYPVESQLPMDPCTRTYALVGGEDYRRPPLDAEWALARFPADIRDSFAS
jgi:hypothetical protein